MNSEQYANIISDLSATFAGRFSQFKETEQKIQIFANPFSVKPSTAPTTLQVKLNHDIIQFYRDFLPSGTYLAVSILLNLHTYVRNSSVR